MSRTTASSKSAFPRASDPVEDDRRLRGNAHDSERAGSMVGQGRCDWAAPIYSRPIWHRCVELGHLKLPLVVILLFATDPFEGSASVSCAEIADGSRPNCDCTKQGRRHADRIEFLGLSILGGG